VVSGLHNLFDDGGAVALAGERGVEFGHAAGQAGGIFGETHRTAEFLGLAAGEFGEVHGERKHLLLKRMTPLVRSRMGFTMCSTLGSM